MFLQRVSVFTLLCSFSTFSQLACQPSQAPEDQDLIGITRRAEEIETEEELARADQAKEDTPAAPQKEERVDAEPQRALNEWARSKMAEQPIDENQLGLASRIVAGVSDLPWNLIIENRGEDRVQLAALPTLLSFEIFSQDNAKQGKDEKLSSADSQEPKGFLCSLKKPKKVKQSEFMLLKPKGILVYSFDPRAYCEDTTQLKAGSSVRAYFGFQPKTKRVWRRGKRVEVKAEAKAPFAAKLEPSSIKEDAEDKAQALLGWNIPEFLLGETYPLETLSALAIEEEPATSDAEQTSEEPNLEPGSTDNNTQTGEGQPLLKLTVSDLSRTSYPNRKSLSARIRNISNKTIRVLVKREAFTFQFDSKSNHISCGLQPDGSPTPKARYTSLRPGQSRQITTRLSEACQDVTWKPGNYKVTGTYTQKFTPAPNDDRYFVGTVTSKTPAKLEVLGGNSAPTMKLLP